MAKHLGLDLSRVPRLASGDVDESFAQTLPASQLRVWDGVSCTIIAGIWLAFFQEFQQRSCGQAHPLPQRALRGHEAVSAAFWSADASSPEGSSGTAGQSDSGGFEVTVPHAFIAPVRLRDGRLFSIDSSMNTFLSDEGRVWDAGGPIVDADGRRNYDPAGTTPHNLCRLHSGAIGLVYWQQSADDADDGSLNGVNQGMFCKSTDEAQSWSAPVPISPARTPSYPTFLIQLQSGRLIVPNEYAFQQASTSDIRSEMSLCSCLYSDDEGNEWRESPDSMFVREDEGASLHFVETPTVAETADGRLLCFMRCEMQRLAQAYR